LAMARSSRDQVMQSSPRSPRSEALSLGQSPRSSVGSWLRARSPERRKASAKAVPDPPVARDPTIEVKSGVATVRRADVYKPHTKGDPYIEVLCGETVIGRTPPCSCYDRRPIFEHTMRMHDFAEDDVVHVVIMSKRSWPYKDIEVARGSLELTKDLFIRRAIEEDIDIFMPAKDGEHPIRYGEEHMAAVYLNIDFVMPISMLAFKKASKTNPPDLRRESDRGIEEHADTAASSASGRRARPRAATNGVDGSVEYRNSTSARGHDRGAGVGGFPVALRRPTALETRQYLVEHQYWGRYSSMASSPVLCTPGVSKLLRSLWSSLLCIKPSPETADDGLIDIDDL